MFKPRHSSSLQSTNGTVLTYACVLYRTIHLQTFKYTFTGQQAVVFLLQQSLAGNKDAASDMCQRMLSQGLFKSIYHRDAFLPDGEVYRFSSSFPDGSKHKGRCALDFNQLLLCLQDPGSCTFNAAGL